MYSLHTKTIKMFISKNIARQIRMMKIIDIKRNRKQAEASDIHTKTMKMSYRRIRAYYR